MNYVSNKTIVVVNKIISCTLDRAEGVDRVAIMISTYFFSAGTLCTLTFEYLNLKLANDRVQVHWGHIRWRL